MKLHQDSKGFEGNLPENRIAMRIENSAKMFEILSSGIYKDKIEAVIREYCCNAYDAQVSAGKKHLPFTVQLPNQIDTTFAVIDEGTGIDPNEIGEIFWTYGHSTKTKRNDQYNKG
jgi:sensor histidine kinase regulating citrate/malate metabolism